MFLSLIPLAGTLSHESSLLLLPLLPLCLLQPRSHIHSRIRSCSAELLTCSMKEKCFQISNTRSHFVVVSFVWFHFIELNLIWNLCHWWKKAFVWFLLNWFTWSHIMRGFEVLSSDQVQHCCVISPWHLLRSSLYNRSSRLLPPHLDINKHCPEAPGALSTPDSAFGDHYQHTPHRLTQCVVSAMCAVLLCCWKHKA